MPVIGWLQYADHQVDPIWRSVTNALDKLGPSDVLLLDRGYPAAWLVNLLQERPSS